MRRLPILALAAAALALAVVMLSWGDEDYRLRLALTNAEGLRAGSSVVVGGARVGEVSGLRMEQPGDRVIADLRMEPSAAPVGRDVSANISAVNLLGQKQVALTVGDTAHPAPSGHTIPPSRVVSSTDLDQVLGVLGPDTRARLAVFINEAGVALGGRRTDLNELLRVLPPGVVDLTQFLEDLVHDNHTLEHAVQTSGEFIASVARKRADMARLVRVVRETARPLAARRTQMLETLDRAPGTLSTLQRFLRRLEGATVPLGPAARALTAAAPSLTGTLDELEPFRRAAAPTLAQATKVAPDLTKLARGATPVLRRARRPVSSLGTFSSDAFPPIARTLDKSVDNIIAIVSNWGHAIQARDRLSHIFRGEVAFTAEAIRSAIGRLELPRRGKSKRSPSRRRAPARPQAPAAPVPVPKNGPAPKLPSVGPTIDKAVEKTDDAVNGLLDYLLKP